MVILALGQTGNLSRVDFACLPVVAKIWISIRKWKDGVQTNKQVLFFALILKLTDYTLERSHTILAGLENLPFNIKFW